MLHRGKKNSTRDKRHIGKAFVTAKGSLRIKRLSYADAVDRNRLISYISGGVAGAAAAFTVGAAIFGVTSRPSRGRASVQVLPSLRGDGFTVSGTF